MNEETSAGGGSGSEDDAGTVEAATPPWAKCMASAMDHLIAKMDERDTESDRIATSTSNEGSGETLAGMLEQVDEEDRPRQGLRANVWQRLAEQIVASDHQMHAMTQQMRKELLDLKFMVGGNAAPAGAPVRQKRLACAWQLVWELDGLYAETRYQWGRLVSLLDDAGGKLRCMGGLSGGFNLSIGRRLRKSAGRAAPYVVD